MRNCFTFWGRYLLYLYLGPEDNVCRTPSAEPLPRDAEGRRRSTQVLPEVGLAQDPGTWLLLFYELAVVCVSVLMTRALLVGV